MKKGGVWGIIIFLNHLIRPMKYEFFIKCTLNPKKSLTHILNAMYHKDKHFKIAFFDLENSLIKHEKFTYDDGLFLVFDGIDVINNFPKFYSLIKRDFSIAIFDEFDSYIQAFESDFVYRQGHYFYVIHYYFSQEYDLIFSKNNNDNPLDNFIWLDNDYTIDVCTIISDYNDTEINNALEIFKI